jgi:hypothetical protein
MTLYTHQQHWRDSGFLHLDVITHDSWSWHRLAAVLKRIALLLIS